MTSNGLRARAAAFWRAARRRELTLFSGVPCSYLRVLIEAAYADPGIRYVPAVREEAAVGIASGAYLAGGLGGVLIQNSGLGNLVNALTSFNLLYRVPLLIVVSWRGEGGRDAPEHLLMGAKMHALLDWLEVPHLDLEPDRVSEQVDLAVDHMLESLRPFALVARKGIFG